MKSFKVEKVQLSPSKAFSIITSCLIFLIVSLFCHCPYSVSTSHVYSHPNINCDIPLFNEFSSSGCSNCKNNNDGCLINQEISEGISVIRTKDSADFVASSTDLENKDWYLEQIIKLGTAISQLDDSQLVPGPLANTLFGGLVSIVREFPSFNVSSILMNPIVQFLQPLVVEKCSSAEYLLEANFSRQVILNGVKLCDFMYYENYELLVEFEMKCLEKYIFPSKLDEITQIAIVGGGPLPLTSIVLSQYFNKSTTIANYDHSEEANALGKGVVTACGLDDRISFVKCTALHIQTLGTADVVYLAALVGSNSQEKREIINHLYKIMKPGSVLAARSSTGLREFIYHPITKEEFGHFEQFIQWDPENKVIINSIAFGKKSAKR